MVTTYFNAIPKHAGPETKGSNPTTGFNLLWARNPSRGNFNHWQVLRNEAGQIFLKRQHGCGKINTMYAKNCIFTDNDY